MFANRMIANVREQLVREHCSSVDSNNYKPVYNKNTKVTKKCPAVGTKFHSLCELVKNLKCKSRWAKFALIDYLRISSSWNNLNKDIKAKCKFLLYKKNIRCLMTKFKTKKLLNIKNWRKKENILLGRIWWFSSSKPHT